LRAERRSGEPSSAEHAANQQQIATQLASEVVRLKQALVEDHQLAAILTSRVDAARVEQQRTAVQLEQRTAECERLVGERTAERARLQQEIADEHERARTFEREARGFDDVRAQVTVTLAETADLRASLERRETEYQRLLAEQATERADLQQAAAAERELCQGLERQVKEFAEVQLRLEVALDSAVADTADLKALQTEAQSVVKDLRSKLVNAAAERTRLDTLLKQRDASEQQSAEQREAERANAERAREDAVRKHAAIVKALADQKLELEILTENIRSVEPLAAAGRLAAEVHEELLAFLAQIELRAQSLIERCALESIDRSEIETLRIETARAALLARQVISPKTVA